MDSGFGISDALTHSLSLRKTLLGASLVVVAMLPGCSKDSSEQSGMTFTNLGVKRASNGGSAAIRGGTPAQRALARSLIASIDGRALRAVTIGSPPQGMRPVPSMGLRGNTWLTIQVRADGSEPISNLTATWKMELLAGAFRDEAKARGLATVLGYNGVVEYPPGRSPLGGSRPQEVGSGISGTFVHKVSKQSSDALATLIRREYENSAKVAGISRVTVSFVRPSQLAVIVDVYASKPQRALRESSFVRSLNAEGLLLRIRTEGGEPFAVRTISARVRAGGSWGGEQGSRR